MKKRRTAQTKYAHFSAGRMLSILGSVLVALGCSSRESISVHPTDRPDWAFTYPIAESRTTVQNENRYFLVVGRERGIGKRAIPSLHLSRDTYSVVFRCRAGSSGSLSVPESCSGFFVAAGEEGIGIYALESGSVDLDGSPPRRLSAKFHAARGVGNPPRNGLYLENEIRVRAGFLEEDAALFDGIWFRGLPDESEEVRRWFSSDRQISSDDSTSPHDDSAF